MAQKNINLDAYSTIKHLLEKHFCIAIERRSNQFQVEFYKVVIYSHGSPSNPFLEGLGDTLDAAIDDALSRCNLWLSVNFKKLN